MSTKKKGSKKSNKKKAPPRKKLVVYEEVETSLLGGALSSIISLGFQWIDFVVIKPVTYISTKTASVFLSANDIVVSTVTKV